MMLKILRGLCKKQSGFTAIEMVIGVVIIGLVGAATATSINQTFSGSTMNNNRMTAINNVRNAGDWISQDARMAENSVTITGNCPSMHWTYFTPLSGDPPSVYDVVYTLSGTDLMRSYQVDGGAPAVITVAQHITINSAVFSNNKFTITLTATVGSASETRTFVVSLRDLPQ